MGSKPYLIFRLHDKRYAIAATEVTEIFFLPELIPVAEAPADILGLLNLHSQFVPVMHLDLRFNHRFDRCHLTDSVIVVESADLQVGVIVHQVETVVEIDDRYIQDDLNYGRERQIDRAFVKGAIDLDDETIILLDVANLVRHPEAVAVLTEADEGSEGDFYERYFPAASTKARETLARRAASLKEANEDGAAVELISLAIVGINGAYFGLELGIVREFIKIGRITTIPCCPQHIIGNTNLRGEILTIVDIRQPLSLAVDGREHSKAAIVEVDEIVAGIAVEEVFDAIELRPEEIQPVPLAIDTNTASYLKGMMSYLGQPLNIIDLPKLLTQGAMTVDLAA